MIEDAKVILGDKVLNLRLHEHGLQCTKKYYGYFTGDINDLNKLLEALPTELSVYEDFFISGIEWGNLQRFGDEAVLHLTWESETS